eukprot:257368_1
MNHQKKRARLSQFVIKPTSIPPQDQESVDKKPLRRSTRVKFKPLAYWANERIKYTDKPLRYTDVEDAFENGDPDTIVEGQRDALAEFAVKTQKKKTKRSKKSSNKQSKKKKTKKKKKKESLSPEPMHDDDDDEEE